MHPRRAATRPGLERHSHRSRGPDRIPEATPGRKPPNPVELLLTRKKKKQPPPLTVRLPPQMLEELNEAAEHEGKARNAVIVHLIRFGLDAYYKSRNVKQPCHRVIVLLIVVSVCLRCIGSALSCRGIAPITVTARAQSLSQPLSSHFTLNAYEKRRPHVALGQ